MHDWWAMILTVAFLALILGSFPWLASRVRRTGVGSSVLAPIQDMWDPIVYRTQAEMEIHAERQAPMPSPEDPPWQRDNWSRD